MPSIKEEKKRKDIIFKYMLKKSGLSYTEFIDTVKWHFITSNLDILTKEEKKMLDVHE